MNAYTSPFCQETLNSEKKKSLFSEKFCTFLLYGNMLVGGLFKALD